jgi:hypothetical protein
MKCASPFSHHHSVPPQQIYTVTQSKTEESRVLIGFWNFQEQLLLNRALIKTTHERQDSCCLDAVLAAACCQLFCTHVPFSCYGYGYSPEVVIGLDGSYKMIKWLTLGRVSHESS